MPLIEITTDGTVRTVILNRPDKHNALNVEMMETLKSTAPFWKKETLADGERWVERNTPG